MRPIPLAFLRARLLAIFMLSLAGVSCTHAALRPKVLSGVLGFLWPPLVLAGATVAGVMIYDRAAAFSDRAGRRRIRPVGWIAWGCIVFMTIVGTLGGKREALLLGASIFAMLQPVFLLLAGLGRGYIGAITNVFALTCCCVVVGGAAAAGAAAAYAGTLIFFLGVDHPARKLGEYPVEEMPDAGPALRRAALLGILTAGALLGFFALVPPRPYEPLRGAVELQPLGPTQMGKMLLQLGFIGALATVSFWLALRMAMGAATSQRELKLVRVGARRSVEARSPETGTAGSEGLAGWRGKIVKLYVRLLSELARAGFRRRPDQTPSELSPLLAPPEAADELTGLFLHARYGPEEMSEADFERASRAGDAVLGRFREGDPRAG